MKKEMKVIQTYIQKHKKAFFALFLLSFCTYGFKLIHFSYSIDSELLLLDNHILKDWISLGRPILVLLKKVFFPTFNPMFSMTWTNLLFPLFPILTYYLFYRITKEENNFKCFLFGAIPLTSAIYIEQLNFTLQSAEMSIMFLLFTLGIFFFELGHEHKKWYFYFASTILTTLSFGTYQSFVLLYITYICLLLFLRITYEHYTWKQVWKYLGQSIAVFFLSFLLYEGLNQVLKLLLNVSKSNYLTKQILWLKEPIFTTIYRILKTMKDGYLGIFKGLSLFYNGVHLLAFFLVVFYFFSLCFTKKESAKSLKILGIMVLVVVPFLLVMLLGTKEAYRSQFSLPIVIAFFLTFLRPSWKGTKKILLTVILCFALISQFKNTKELLFSDYIRYQNDVQFASQLYLNLSSYNLSEKRLVFLGYHQDQSPLILKVGETMAHSFFEWDKETFYGVSNRAVAFMKSLGYNVSYPTDEDMLFARQIEPYLTVYPEEGSIKEYSDKIIIRLS